MSDILDRIDAAVGCQRCGGPLGPSPSDDFCNQRCQQAWHAARTKPLERYVEAADDNVLSGDDRAGTGERPDYVFHDAVIVHSGQIAAPARRVGRYADLQIDPQMILSESAWRDWEAVLARVQAAFRAHTEQAIAQFDRLAHEAFEGRDNDLLAVGTGQPQGVAQDPEPPTAQQRALELRRTRNTGPDNHRRAPRTIGRPR